MTDNEMLVALLTKYPDLQVTNGPLGIYRDEGWIVHWQTVNRCERCGGSDSFVEEEEAFSDLQTAVTRFLELRADINTLRAAGVQI